MNLSELKTLASQHIKVDSKFFSRLKKRLYKKIDTIYNHGDIYALVYKGQKNDRNFYLKEGSKGKILYLGVGSGRIFNKLSSENSLAYGLDCSAEMINFLTPESQKKLIVADVRSAKIKSMSFDKIIAPYCFLNQFEHNDVRKILKNCSKWLKPGGTLVTDFFSPFANPIGKNCLQKDKSQKENMTVESFEIYDFVRQRLLELTFIRSKSKSLLLMLPLYYYFPNEIFRLFIETGFVINKFYGDFNKKIFTTKSEIIVAFAKLA